jgi:hypothetical protein
MVCRSAEKLVFLKSITVDESKRNYSHAQDVLK